MSTITIEFKFNETLIFNIESSTFFIAICRNNMTMKRDKLFAVTVHILIIGSITGKDGK